jgi:hypothetical protein
MYKGLIGCTRIMLELPQTLRIESAELEAPDVYSVTSSPAWGKGKIRISCGIAARMSPEYHYSIDQ